MLASLLRLRPLDSWRWTHWTVVLAAAAYLASYFGLVSWALVDDMLRGLAGYAPLDASVTQSPSQRHEALFVIFAFLLLTVPAVLALVLLVGFVVMVTSGVLEPLTHQTGIPESVPRVVVLAVLAVLAWQFQDLWLPSVRWIAGLGAAAYLSLSG